MSHTQGDLVVPHTRNVLDGLAQLQARFAAAQQQQQPQHTTSFLVSLEPVKPVWVRSECLCPAWSMHHEFKQNHN